MNPLCEKHARPVRYVIESAVLITELSDMTESVFVLACDAGECFAEKFTGPDVVGAYPVSKFHPAAIALAEMAGVA